jgi:seryl-tRNA synthetase
MEPKPKMIEDILDRGEEGAALLTRMASQQRAKPCETSSLKLARKWLIPTAEVPLTNLVRESIRDGRSCRSG